MTTPVSSTPIPSTSRPIPPGTSPRTGPEPVPPWVVTELRRDRHRTRRAQDRQGGRRPPRRARRARRADAACSPPSATATAEHRLFHRDAGYLEGRRVRRSRETRAMARRTEFGRDLLAGQWAAAEFAALSRALVGRRAGALPGAAGRHRADARVHRRRRTAQAAPRLAQCRPPPDELADLFEQCVDAMRLLAGAGLRARRPVRLQPAGPPTAGWCSSTCRRSSTWWPTRRGRTTCTATAATSARWFAAARAGHASSSTTSTAT